MICAHKLSDSSASGNLNWSSCHSRASASHTDDDDADGLGRTVRTDVLADNGMPSPSRAHAVASNPLWREQGIVHFILRHPHSTSYVHTGIFIRTHICIYIRILIRINVSIHMHIVPIPLAAMLQTKGCSW